MKRLFRYIIVFLCRYNTVNNNGENRSNELPVKSRRYFKFVIK